MRVALGATVDDTLGSVHERLAAVPDRGQSYEWARADPSGKRLVPAAAESTLYVNVLPPITTYRGVVDESWRLPVLREPGRRFSGVAVEVLTQVGGLTMRVYVDAATLTEGDAARLLDGACRSTLEVLGRPTGTGRVDCHVQS